MLLRDKRKMKSDNNGIQQKTALPFKKKKIHSSVKPLSLIFFTNQSLNHSHYFETFINGNLSFDPYKFYSCLLRTKIFSFDSSNGIVGCSASVTEMAAYAAVQSLMRLLEGIMDADPDWVLHDKPRIEFLRQKVSFLRCFLEEYSVPTNEVVTDLEIKIRDIAYNAEDIIETYVSDQLLSKSDQKNEEVTYQTFCRVLEKAIEEICCIQEEAMAIRGRILELNSLQERNGLSMDRSKLAFSGKNTIMVGFDDDLIKIKDWVTSSCSKLEVISIVGMGGIGKTTLARNVSDDPLIVSHFDIRSWVTVSQEYQVREIFAGLLGHSTSELSQESEEKLAERLYKSLKGRRYLVVMDDLWETKAWDDVKRLLPDDNNGSRIILTTRLTDVGVYATSGNHVLNLSVLSSIDSWSLLCKKVFGEESCPDDLVGIGQDIARYCRGLPLSLVVVGGLLSMDKTVGYWETVASSINSILATDGGQCSIILSLSYNHLPVHLKPCFLYFAAFPEDYQIQRSNLIKLWVAEGFVKAENSDRLEDIAQRYLEDLVNRSLIMVFRLGYGGKVKTYRIHDLLRDFCIIEAQKTKFFHVTNRYTPTQPMQIKSERRVCIYHNIPLEDYFYDSSGPTLLTRSLHCFFSSSVSFSISELVGLRFLRILDIGRIWLNEFPIEVVRLVHLRYLSLCCWVSIIPASISSIWGLQTLIINPLGRDARLPLEVWKMPHLKHLQIKECYLPDPPCSKVESKNFVAMANLQTLLDIINFRFTGEIVRRLPKLMKLKVLYDVKIKDWPLYHLSNIVCLNKLEALEIISHSKIAFPENCKFPSSLKKLTLYGCLLPWEDLTMVGSLPNPLPNLEVLMLGCDACKGQVWEPNEGEFCELKFLQLNSLDLVQWRADDSHFRKLKRLQILWCFKLEEIPIEIGSIETLERIELEGCIPSAVTSVLLILDQQRSFGNDDLRVDI